MSIETKFPLQTDTMGSEKHKSKADNKSKSSHGEKKRKRDHTEEGPKTKAKKQKSDSKAAESEVLSAPATISPFHMQTSSLYLPLAPVSQKFPLEGICAEHLSPLLLTYYPPFNGVLLSYSNPRLSEKAFGNDGEDVLLQNHDEYAVSWTWLTAEFLLFKPEKGAWLEGYVNLQNEGHLGLVCWNLFNASIERKRLPSDWKWKDVSDAREGWEGEGETYAEEGSGHYVDGEGKKIEGMVKFRVREIESSHDRERGFLSIEGTMLSETAEKKLVEDERNGVETSRDTAGRRLGGSRALGATSLGVAVETDAVDGEAKRHRQR
ncbi:related to dna-dependent rna polymerase I subunit a43 (rpa43) [Rhynchosporium graminicola]|uniref:DNA-directed RNA polymerase subunit n=1 Tax=Rhynchosporium graminicola TaxID=2792576 RepID=A0A1E1JQT7_9HELO|nr:related to dna-dependent rna polymerase I subunit a43 (rpa43) [Rhynchosporium commune]